MAGDNIALQVLTWVFVAWHGYEARRLFYAHIEEMEDLCDEIKKLRNLQENAETLS